MGDIQSVRYARSFTIDSVMVGFVIVVSCTAFYSGCTEQKTARESSFTFASGQIARYVSRNGKRFPLRKTLAPPAGKLPPKSVVFGATPLPSVTD